MNLRTDINKLIGDIIDDECKANPDVKEIIYAALNRELTSTNNSRTAIIKDYENIVSKHHSLTGDSK